MPACSLEPEVNGRTALFRISGKFDGACAWQLAGRLEQEPLSKVVVDFSQANEFVDPSHSIRRRLPAPRLPEGPGKGAAKEVV